MSYRSPRPHPSADAPDEVEQAVLDDLRERLHRTRHVGLPEGVEWTRGTDARYLAELVDTWGRTYDWRPQERRIRAYPWALAGEGSDRLRVIHQRATDPSAPVVVLLHGWPDSILRFERVLTLLQDVTVVVPALPGFPFSIEPVGIGMSVTRMAQILADALAGLGYDRYVLSGGDVGGDVAEQLAAAHPERVSALHLTNLSPRHLPAIDPALVTEPERRALRSARDWQMSEGGYIAEQSTKPNSLAPGLGDSPAGLAAWMVEKLRSWSDCGGDVESVFPREDLLTWLTAYWVTDTIGTSMSSYVERPDPVDEVPAPAVMTLFARDIKPVPRALAERFLDVRAWIDYDTGGHFAAWEQPSLYVEGVRAALHIAES